MYIKFKLPWALNTQDTAVCTQNYSLCNEDLRHSVLLTEKEKYYTKQPLKHTLFNKITLDTPIILA